MTRLPRRSLSALLALAAGAATAQTQVVRPAQAQAWIDVATYSGMGLPGGMGGAAGGGGAMSMLGAMLGGGAAGSEQRNTFGQTQVGSAGRWVDVTLSVRANPALAQAEQQVPATFLPSPLKLQAPQEVRTPAPSGPDDQVVEPSYEKPRGKLLLYWGCSATVRPGQPKVLDMASATPADLAAFFQARRATQRGTHSAVGRPVWPNPADARMVPAAASLVGDHAFVGASVPEGFRLRIPAAQDLMPALDVAQQPQGGATDLSWTALPTARGYFIAGIGASAKEEMVLWTSSELPDSGFGLIDYQTNVAVDRWLQEGVLLKPATTRCTVPKGVFPGESAMLRLIAYGSELNLAHPPRPSDVKVPWEPVWAAKIRVKSVANIMLGMPAMPSMSEPRANQPAESGAPAPAKKDEMPKPLDMLRGILGR
jgi:hypothetical protein